MRKAFYHRKDCKVRTDSTIRLLNKDFEVDSIYMGQTVEVHFNPVDLDEIWVVDNDEWKPIKQVNKQENAKIKRKKEVYY